MRQLGSRDARSELCPTIALLTTVLLWSSAFAAIRVEYRGIDQDALGLVRLACASMMLAAGAAIRGLRSPSPAGAARIAVAALLFVINVAITNHDAYSWRVVVLRSPFVGLAA
jgi:hypothetical protein